MSAVRTTLQRTTVAEAMTGGVISCAADATVADVARLMAAYRVHAVAVCRTDGEAQIWAFVSDAEILAAVGIAAFEDLTAGAIAGTEPLTVDAGDTLAAAAGLLSEHQCSHAVVMRDGAPAGVVSSLDIVRHIGAAEGWPPARP